MRALGMMALLVAAGCFSTTIRSGKPVGETSFEADEKWHHGFVSGAAEASGPYDLDKLCPDGWAEIETHTSFFNGVLEVASMGLYNPQTVSVKCAATARATSAARR